MATTRFFLDLRGKAKDGKGSVLITLYHNYSTATFPTGIRIFPENWQDQKVVRISGAESINANLANQKSKIDKAIALLSLDDNFEHMTASDMKANISDGKPKKIRGHLLSDVFAEYMNSGNLKEGTKQIYRQTLNKITSFTGENFKVESINLKWLRSLEQYMAKTQSINGRSMYLRSLKAVCNYARHNGIVFEYPFDNFHIKQEETRKRCIEIEKLREYYSLDTSKKNAYYRDYFFLMLFLIGINTIDLLTAKKSQVIDGRLVYTRAKTGKHYSIKIEPEAEALLKKYEGKGEYLLEALDHCKHYRSFAREINDAIKTIGIFVEDQQEDLFEQEPQMVLKPLIPDITSYFARHTWSTLAHELDISSDVICMAFGHTPSNRTTFIYIKPDQSKVDEANRRIIDYLLKCD